MRPTLLAFAVALLLVAGCAAPADGPATSRTPSSSPSSETYVGTDCPYLVSASTATASQLNRTDRRVDFSDLSDSRQAEFERMVASESVEFETLPEAWSSPVLVDYRGATYYVVAQTC